jgi:hypothetical protein
MIVILRKHAKWLMIPLFSLVIISFLFFMSSGPARNGGSGGSTSVNTNIVGGEIYGEKVTPEKYDRIEHDVDLYFLFNYGQWALHNPNLTQQRLQQEIYVRMMLLQKAQSGGVHVSDDQVEQAAANYLRSPTLLRAMGVSGQSVPFNDFVQQVLPREDLTAADFENFVRDDLSVQQLQNIYGLSGELITPQEAAAEYVRNNEELSAQIVFFSASNYLSDVTVTPAEVGMFYTNFMAEYRLPDRVQVNYVVFSVSNYLAQAKLEVTNLDAQVASIYSRYGMQVVPDAKTPDEARAEIRNVVLRRAALVDAGNQADDFAQAVFNIEPALPQNLSTVARQKGLPIQTTAPFSADYGPEEFAAPAVFTKTAFELTPDSPISEPIAGPDGVYIIALETNLPSEIPSLEDIRGRVADDLRFRIATLKAQQAGSNFTVSLSVRMALGKSFAAATIAEGYDPQVLPPFALSTQEMPDLGDQATLNQLKQAAFTTRVGSVSNFRPTDDGGFVLYVESRLPVDQSKMAAELPQFTAQLREQREMQAFNSWVQREASRQLRSTPIFRAATAE